MVVDSNLIAQAVGYTYSSAATGYPASNALDLNRRRRTWRSAGYWDLTATNTLVFQETAGVDLTATVAGSPFTSDAALFAAIKAALQAVGTSTYTVSRDPTTLKIVITAVLAGGATVFRIRATAGASAGLCGIIGYNTGADLTGALAYTADLLRIHTSEWFVFDFGFPVSPTAFLAAADRNIPFRTSNRATVRLQGNITNSFAPPLVDVGVQCTDRGIAYVDKNGIGGSPCRYWRVLIQDVDNAYGYAEIGAMVLGTHAVITRGGVSFPFGGDAVDYSQVGLSEGGQISSAQRAKTKLFNLNWQGLDTPSYQYLARAWEAVGLTQVFAVVLDPNQAFSTDLLRWTILARFSQAPKESLNSPGNWTYQWVVREDL